MRCGRELHGRIVFVRDNVPFYYCTPHLTRGVSIHLEKVTYSSASTIFRLSITDSMLTIYYEKMCN